MINLKLKGKVVENKLSLKQLSELMNLSYPQLLNKVNGINKFNVDEVKAISNILNLTNDDIINIFFKN